MTYAEKISGAWVVKTPREFMAERNASIPAGQLEAEGLFAVTSDPRPDMAGQVVEPGPIVDRSGRPVRTWTTRKPTAAEAEDIRADLHAKINAERDRRLGLDFTFAGKRYQRDGASVARITGAATLAGFAIGAGAQPGNLRWHGGPTDFAWIASDNSLTPMDAQTTFAFGQTCANVETRLIFAAKALREMDPIPRDYQADKYWP